MAHRQSVVNIEEVTEGMFDCIIDVRSEGEFAEDHIPGAINCPVLDDEQHAQVGMIYNQDSPFEARRKGAAIASRNIAAHIEERFSDKERSWKPLIYCWRGGQRSASMHTVFRAVGWNAALLKGGYKAYRSDVIARLKDLPREFKYVVIGGPTGSGKTVLLGIMEEQGAQVLDLEGMAGHRGSVLGFDPEAPQQSQKSFDTSLAHKLSGFDAAKPVFVEAESRKIGRDHLPSALFEEMKCGELVVLDLPMDERVGFLSREYVWFKKNPDELKDKLSRLKEIRGKKTIERWFAQIDAGEWDLLVRDLLEVHYDPLYQSSSRKGYTDENSRHVFACDCIDGEAFVRLSKDIIAWFGG